MFLFNVTMQNHSSYTETFDNFTPGIAVEKSDNFNVLSYKQEDSEKDTNKQNKKSKLFQMFKNFQRFFWYI